MTEINPAEVMASPKQRQVHRPNGPYLPVGDIGGEYCVKCRTPWPCLAATLDTPAPVASEAEGQGEHCQHGGPCQMGPGELCYTEARATR